MASEANWVRGTLPQQPASALSVLAQQTGADGPEASITRRANGVAMLACAVLQRIHEVARRVDERLVPPPVPEQGPGTAKEEMAHAVFALTAAVGAQQECIGLLDGILERL